jgi:nucleoside-diphosphate-sugar epimerase
LTGKALVTGYGGFIGRHLCQRLNEGGYSIYGIEREEQDIDYITQYNADICEREGFEDVPTDYDLLIHLAAISYVPDAQANIERAYDVNFLGTYHALEHFRKSKADTFIFASTAKVYGKPEYLPLDEKHALKPDNIYGHTKMLSEKLIQTQSEETDKRYITLRQFNIYGPGQSNDFFIPTVIEQLSRGDNLELGDIDVSRDFLYIDDLIDAYMKMIDKASKGFNAYNVGSGKAVKLAKIIDECSDILSKDVKVIQKKERVRTEVPEIYANIKGISSSGWSPKWDINSGLKRMVEEHG